MKNDIKGIFVAVIISSMCMLGAMAQSAASDTLQTMKSAGEKVWILVPKYVANDIDKVMKGEKEIRSIDNEIDINEKALVHGDTVSMYVKDRNLGRFDRGLYNNLFIPKGIWQFGLTASYGEFDAGDYQIFDLLTDFDFTGHTFSIKPYISYFLKNNLSVGMRLGYTNAKAGLGSLAVDFDEDLNFAISDVHYNNESYTAAIFARQYIGLARRGRFAVFNEMELSFSSAHGDFIRKYNDSPRHTETTSMEARLSFSPGLCVFMQKNICFNVSFGVLGFYLKNEKQRTDGVESGSRLSSGANFKFNIFNINFGLGIQI